MEKSVFITGATGRLGRILVKQLCGKNWNVTALVRDVQKAKKVLPLQVTLIKGDLKTTSLDVLAEGMRGKSALVHLAAVVDFQASEIELHDANVEGTRRVIQAASVAHVPRLIHMSSTGIYHHPKKLPIDENQEPSPMPGYGESKLEAEKIVKKSGLDYIMIRAPAIYGKGFDEGFSQVILWLKKGSMPIIGSGKNHIPLIHVNDVALALVLALEKNHIKNQAYIVTSGELLTQEQTFLILASALRLPPPIRRVPVWMAYLMVVFDFFSGIVTGKRKLLKLYVDFLAQDRVFDISKAKRELGFVPKIGLKKGVAELVKP